MSTIKNIPDKYTINVPTMVVNGNLTVLGNTTTVESSTLTVYDNLITLNGNVTGTPSFDATIQINRGLSANTAIRWHESTQTWQITNNGTTYGNIVAAAPSGNINITNTTLYTNPTSGNVQIYANTAGSGGSGVYVTNTQTTGAELVTKSKAVAYSIVFG
jgi:hypothetical protein